MTRIDEYQQAEREMLLEEAGRGFRSHATVYLLVNLGLITLNTLLVVFTGASFFWFPFPLIGWGIGLAIHYVQAVRHAYREVERHQREIEERAARMPRAA